MRLLVIGATGGTGRMRNCEAVLSVLGPPLPPRAWPGPSTILGEGAQATVDAMQRAGMKRLLIVSGELCFPDPGAPVALLRATLLRHLASDQATMERVICDSALDWTIARPTRLTNGPITAEYRAEVERRPRGARPISRADVADFLLGAVEKGAYLRQTVGLAR